MATDNEGSWEPDATSEDGALGTGVSMTEDDERIFRIWLESSVLQDPRYQSDGLVQLARASMTDDELRQELIDDTVAVIERVRSKIDLPEAELKFFDNTPETLNVVLPPRAGEMSARSYALRAMLRSRTGEVALFGDDFDRGNLFNLMDSTDQGDGHPIDHWS
jgi:hypothetical protein